MRWEPTPTVTIGGIDYSGSTLTGVTISMGRPDTTQQPQAGYANLTILDLTSAPSPFTLGAEVEITALDSTSTPIPLFTGTISDVLTTVATPSHDGHVTTHTILAVGPTARLNRRTVGATGYASQGDGDRVAEILAAALATPWNGEEPTMTWATAPATTSWELWDPYLGQIDRPGLYTLAAYTEGEANAYELAGVAALSGLGVVYETPDGRINYADANHRQDEALTSGYLEIPAAAILGSGLETSNRLGDAVNAITVAYASGEVTVIDQDSINLIGPAAMTYTTQLASALDATEQADRYLALNAAPKPSIDRIVIPLTALDLTPALIDALAGIRVGRPIRLTGLPASIGDDFSGFVEGWKWILTDNTALLELSISDFGRSVITTKWASVLASLRYSTTTATLEWQEATVII